MLNIGLNFGPSAVFGRTPRVALKLKTLLPTEASQGAPRSRAAGEAPAAHAATYAAAALTARWQAARQKPPLSVSEASAGAVSRSPFSAVACCGPSTSGWPTGKTALYLASTAVKNASSEIRLFCRRRHLGARLDSMALAELARFHLCRLVNVPAQCTSGRTHMRFHLCRLANALIKCR